MVAGGWGPRIVRGDRGPVGGKLLAKVVSKAECTMKISARNVLKGKVKSLHEGAVNTEVVIDVGGAEVASIITKQSADTLKLRIGSEVHAVMKASDVMVAVNE